MATDTSTRSRWSLATVCSVLIIFLAMGSGDALAKKDKKKKKKKEEEGKIVKVLPEPVSPKQLIRFYKVNKQIQADRIMVTNEKASSAGCQNFLKKVRVHRTVQIGFLACTLYEKKNCDDRYIVTAETEKNPRRSSLLTEGRGWYPHSESDRGATVGSWNCAMGVEPDQLEFETRLAKKEVARLKQESTRAAIKAAEAQKKANRAKKSAEDAVDQAYSFRELALAAGVEFFEDRETETVLKSEDEEDEDEDSEDGEKKNKKKNKSESDD
ncbi:MAG: hypothetical protein AAF431_02810 [Pseudomonadota bacterium]